MTQTPRDAVAVDVASDLCEGPDAQRGAEASYRSEGPDAPRGAEASDRSEGPDAPRGAEARDRSEGLDAQRSAEASYRSEGLDAQRSAEASYRSVPHEDFTPPDWWAPSRRPRGYYVGTSRGDAAAATRIFRRDASRRRRGRDADIPQRRVAATPRPRRGYFVETRRGDAGSEPDRPRRSDAQASLDA